MSKRRRHLATFQNLIERMTPIQLGELMQADCTSNELAAKVCRYQTVLRGKCPKCGKKYIPKSQR